MEVNTIQGRTTAVAIAVALALAALIGPFFGGGMMGGFDFPWAGGWGLGMALGWLWMLAFWGALILGGVALVRWLGESSTRTGSSHEETPLDILKRRYAKGEIDQATYERMRRELGV